jgi:O-antigen/teichoic acid export membrane protein
VPSVLFILIFGDRILFIFSKEYATQAFQILQLLSIATLFSTVMQIYLSIKRIQKDIKIINILNLTASLLIIMTGYFFLSEFGLVGMGYAWIITNAIMCVIVIYMVYYREKWFK